MTRLKDFSPTNPTGTAPGMEALNHGVIRAAVENVAPVVAASQLVVSAPTKTPLVPKTIRLTGTPQIPFVRVGAGRGRIRYRQSDLDAYIASCLRSSTSERRS